MTHDLASLHSSRDMLSETRIPLQTEDGWTLWLRIFKPKIIRFPQPWLCIHGFSQSHLTWTAGAFAQRIAQMGCVVYVLDLRGHGDAHLAGQSITLQKRYQRAGWDVDAYFMYDVPAALHCIQELHPGQECVLCGHSMGGIFAAATAIRCHEEQIAAVVAISAPFDPLHIGERLRVPARALLRMFPILKKMKTPWHTLPMEHFFAWMNRIYYTGLPKLGRLLPYVTPLDPLQMIPRLWHPKHIDDATVSRILRQSYPEPMEVVMDWARWIETGSILLGKPYAVDYTHLYHRLSVPIVAAWGEDDFLASPAVGNAFRRSVRSKWRVFIDLPQAHHIDITAGTPSKSILDAIRRMLHEALS